MHAEIGEAFDSHLIDHFDRLGSVVDHRVSKGDFGDDGGSEASADANFSAMGFHTDLEDRPTSIPHLLDEGDTVIDPPPPGGSNIRSIEKILEYFVLVCY